ncbi:MAG: AzlD domain-containing protein [Sporomusaceae bacterium]|nr:AzlD domain-containing protein [Sporomusaceae bacterium]
MSENLYLYMAVMAGVTYLIRLLPLTLLRRDIDNVYIKSFLHYVPFVTLSVMTFPAILDATASIWSAVSGFAAALMLAYTGSSLFKVSAAACVVVFLVESLV